MNYRFDPFKGAPVIVMRHSPECTDYMRRFLEQSVGELSVILPSEREGVRRRFKAMTADSGVPFPSLRDFEREDWGGWHDALGRQLDRADEFRIAKWYFEDVDPDGTGEIGCPEGCDGGPEARR